MSDLERMSPEMIPLSDGFISHCGINQEEPRDLSIKRKFRPVPPPLDLSKRNLEPDQLTELASPKSPLAQKNLPLRKRAYSWSSQPENLGFQLAPGATQSVIRTTIDAPDDRNSTNSCSLSSATCSSTSLKFAGLPTPQTPHTPHPHSAIPVITSRFSFGENLSTSSINPSSKLSYSNQGPLNLSTANVGAIPSSLLSPAPSHPSSSSLNSSREELEPEVMSSDCQMISPPHISPQLMSGSNLQRVNTAGTMEHSGDGLTSPVGSTYIPPSPNYSHQWPTTVWSIFLAGVQVNFVLGGGRITGARLSEELRQLERPNQQYAPHGLQLLKIIYEDYNQYNNSANNPAQYIQLYFRPVVVQQQDILVVAPPDHPFYVHGKGWCSLLVEQASERYNIPCQQLHEGDICLPPYHPETTNIQTPVVTPDLTDAMKRFDFSDENNEMNGQGSCSAPPSATFPVQTQRSVFLSPPASPSKKSAKNPINSGGNGGGGGGESGVGLKSRRPMNGFMLFAKHHRLKLIQQYPGKDNRAISVLLGAMWKALPDEDREMFNSEARFQAEERKRIDPDCWKRKRSHSTS